MIYSHGMKYGHPRCTITDNYYPSIATVATHSTHCGDNNDDNAPAPHQTNRAEYSTEVSGRITVTTDGTSPLSIHCGGAVGCSAEIAF